MIAWRALMPDLIVSYGCRIMYRRGINMCQAAKNTMITGACALTSAVISVPPVSAKLLLWNF